MKTRINWIIQFLGINRLEFSKFHLIAILCILISTGCNSFTGKYLKRDLQTIDFLIQVTDLPPGWQLDKGAEYFYEVETLDATQIVFTAKTNAIRNGAFMAVYRGASILGAKHLFNNVFGINMIGVPPQNWEKINLAADENNISCYDDKGNDPPYCRWVARYDEYIVTFNTWIIPGFMSTDDMIRIIKKIDDRMVDKLEIESIP